MWYASSMGTIVLATKKYDENEQLERTHTHEAEEIPQSSNCFCSSIHILLCLRTFFLLHFFAFGYSGSKTTNILCAEQMLKQRRSRSFIRQSNALTQTDDRHKGRQAHTESDSGLSGLNGLDGMM